MMKGVDIRMLREKEKEATDTHTKFTILGVRKVSSEPLWCDQGAQHGSGQFKTIPNYTGETQDVHKRYNN